MTAADVHVEARDCAAVAWYQGRAHGRYEDRYRLLCRGIPLVDAAERGELFAIADGLGDTERASQAAQRLCDRVSEFFDTTRVPAPTPVALLDLVRGVHEEIRFWGRDARGLPMGAAAASVIWLLEDRAHVVQAGDTLVLLVREGGALPLTQRRRSVEGLRACLGAAGLDLTVETSPIEEGDRIVLATNTVADRLSQDRIAACAERSPTPARAAEALVRGALGDGRADATAIVVDVEWP